MFQANRIGQGKGFAKVGELEAHQQEESFLHWLHKNMGEQLKNVLKESQGWQDVHDLFTSHGAVIKPRGAGLAIATLDGSVGIKSSSLDRKLSFKSLTDRFGEYQPPKEQGRNSNRYQRSSRPPGMNSLYADYQRSRDTNYGTRTKALSEARTEYNEYRIKLKDWYRQRRASVKSNAQMDNRTKRVAYSELSLELKTDIAQLKEREQDAKNTIRKKSPAQTWDEYLASRAEQGDPEALSILRRRNNYRRQITQTLLTIDNVEEARDVVRAHFKPTVLKNGRVIYRARDGGVVSDEAAAIKVLQVTEAATLLAISLADERFQGKALVVEGSYEFKLQVAELAALEGMSIRLADPLLEKDRQSHVKDKELNQNRLKQSTQEKGGQLERDSDREYRGR